MHAANSLLSPPEAIPYASFTRTSPTPTTPPKPSSRPLFPKPVNHNHISHHTPNHTHNHNPSHTHNQTHNQTHNHHLNHIQSQDQSHIHFPSPPVSPCEPSKDTQSSHHREPTIAALGDPILYPASDILEPQTSTSQVPLFATDDEQAAIDHHLATRDANVFTNRHASPPRRDDYVLILGFKSKVLKKYCERPEEWWRRERGFLRQDAAERNRLLTGNDRSGTGSGNAGRRRALVNIAPALGPRPSTSTTARAFRVEKNRRERDERGGHRSAVATTSATSTGAPLRVPRPKVARGGTPGEKTRHTTTTTREDRDFASLPDFCPPISSLPARPNSLKVEWKGAPLDLSSDPHAHLLHADEVALASNLRLDCATYLTSKRRLFMGRRECWERVPRKEFRKTDAQQACRIDVNKASKLWVAFEKVGWLGAGWCNRVAE